MYAYVCKTILPAQRASELVAWARSKILQTGVLDLERVRSLGERNGADQFVLGFQLGRSSARVAVDRGRLFLRETGPGPGHWNNPFYMPGIAAEHDHQTGLYEPTLWDLEGAAADDLAGRENRGVA